MWGVQLMLVNTLHPLQDLPLADMENRKRQVAITVLLSKFYHASLVWIAGCGLWRNKIREELRKQQVAPVILLSFWKKQAHTNMQHR
jgi:hypothetical protein